MKLSMGNLLPLYGCNAVVLCLHLPGAPDLLRVRRMNSQQNAMTLPGDTGPQTAKTGDSQG